jgi:hypothetical protein
VTTATPLAAATGATVAPEFSDTALRDAVRTLASARLQAAHEPRGVGGRWLDDGGALAGEAGAAVAREVAAFARAARGRGTSITDVLVAVSAVVRAAGAPMDIGPREAVVRDASRCCVKAFYEARAGATTTPADAGSARP